MTTEIYGVSNVVHQLVRIAMRISDTRLVFVCRNCDEQFAESLEMYVNADEQEIMAPNLCPSCGRYDAEI